MIKCVLSEGMTAAQCIWHVVLPQAVKLMIPPMGGVYVIIIKGTSIVSVIGIAELVRAGEHATQRHPRELLDLRHDRAYVLRLLLPGLADRPLGRDQIRQRSVAVVSPKSGC